MRANEPKNVRIRAGSVNSNTSNDLEPAELRQWPKQSCRELFFKCQRAWLREGNLEEGLYSQICDE